MNYKVGDRVLCIREDAHTEFIGHVWEIVEVCSKYLVYAENKELFCNPSIGHYLFRVDEIAPMSSLLEELL
jgi:hypothetical protein